MTFDPNEEYGENKIVLTVEGEYQGYSVEAYSCPDADGRTFIGDGDTEIGDVATEKLGAPFRVDLVLTDHIYPMEGEIADIRDEVGSSFGAQFEGKIDSVFQKLNDTDDPIKEIKQMEPDEL